MGLQVDFSIIASVLTAWTMLLEDQNIPIDTTLLKNCILLLRVACVQGSSVQTQILHHDHCLKNIHASTSHPNDTVTRSTWQLCSNLLVQCPENVEKAITDLLPLCLSNLEVATKDVDVIAAVIYNLLEANKLLGSPVELSKFEIYKGALDAIYRHPEEQFTFLQFLLEQFLTGDAEPKEAYLALGRDRIKLHHYVTEYVKSDVHELSSPFLRVLSESYNRLADNILTWFNGHVSTAEPEELLSLLECLSTITGTPKYSLAYKSEASIFINSGGLLVACCESQKSEVAAKDKLSDFQVTGEKEEDRFFDFKTLLIRLIGNLAHKNKKNQDYVSEGLWLSGKYPSLMTRLLYSTGP